MSTPNGVSGRMHTPGPWHVLDTPSGLAIVAAPLTKEATGKVIVYGAGIMSKRADDKANATLIAAAPVLVAALAEARKELDRVARTCGNVCDAVMIRSAEALTLAGVPDARL